jgi:K+-sensing histidine kinase KdpD
VVRTLIQRISQSLSRSDKLIQDLLDVNQIISHEPFHLEPERINLYEMVAEIVSPLILLYGDRFIIQGDRLIEGHWSPRELSRAIELIIDMSVHYSLHQAPVLVSMNSTKDEAMISVHSNGKIEPPRTVANLSYEGLDEVQLKQESRLSLSWTLIECFVKAHQGEVKFQSSDEQGTDIKVTIPRHPRYSS